MFEFSSSIFTQSDDGNDEESGNVRSEAFDTLGSVLLQEKSKREAEMNEERDRAKRRRTEEETGDPRQSSPQAPLFSPSRYTESQPHNTKSPIRVFEDPQSRSGSEYNSYGDSVRSEDDGEAYVDENVDPITQNNPAPTVMDEENDEDDEENDEVEEEIDESVWRSEEEQQRISDEVEESEDLRETEEEEQQPDASVVQEFQPGQSLEMSAGIAAVDSVTQTQEGGDDELVNKAVTNTTNATDSEGINSAQTEAVALADIVVQVPQTQSSTSELSESASPSQSFGEQSEILDSQLPRALLEPSSTVQTDELFSSSVPLDPALFSTAQDNLIHHPPVLTDDAEAEESGEDEIHHNDSDNEDSYSEEALNATDESKGEYQDDDEGEEVVDEMYEDENSESRRNSVFIDEDEIDEEIDEDDEEGEYTDEQEEGGADVTFGNYHNEEEDEQHDDSDSEDYGERESDQEETADYAGRFRITGKSRPSGPSSLLRSVQYASHSNDKEEEEDEEGEEDDDDDEEEEYDYDNESEPATFYRAGNLEEAGTQDNAITLSSDDEDNDEPAASPEPASRSSSPTSESGSYSGADCDENEESFITSAQPENYESEALQFPGLIGESSGSLWTPSIPRNREASYIKPQRMSLLSPTIGYSDGLQSKEDEDQSESELDDTFQHDDDEEDFNELSDINNGHGDDSSDPEEDEMLQREEIRKELEVERTEGELDDAPEDLAAKPAEGEEEEEEPFIEEEFQPPLVHESDSDPDAHYPEEFDDYDTGVTASEDAKIRKAAETIATTGLPALEKGSEDNGAEGAADLQTGKE